MLGTKNVRYSRIRFELVNMTFALCFNAVLVKKKNFVWKFVSNFALNVNFSIFQKNLVTYVTPSIYCSSFYCSTRFYLVVDIVFLNALSKSFWKPCTCYPNIGCFWLYRTIVTGTYVMPFFEGFNWNSVFECSDDLHVWYRMKAYRCEDMKANDTWKQNVQT